MRTAIGSTWIYQLVIIFILLFVSFLILSLTYSKNYKTKNEIINIIEKYEGVNSKSIQIINNYLIYNNYGTKGSCPTTGNWMGVTDLKSTKLEKTRSGVKYYYCLNKKWHKSSSKTDSTSSLHVKSKMYYQTKTFFKFNLPVLGDLYTFTVDGTTNDIFEGTDLFSSARK